jgi:hypothetical protein
MCNANDTGQLLLPRGSVCNLVFTGGSIPPYPPPPPPHRRSPPIDRGAQWWRNQNTARQKTLHGVRKWSDGHPHWWSPRWDQHIKEGWERSTNGQNVFWKTDELQFEIYRCIRVVHQRKVKIYVNYFVSIQKWDLFCSITLGIQYSPATESKLNTMGFENTKSTYVLKHSNLSVNKTCYGKEGT